MVAFSAQQLRHYDAVACRASAEVMAGYSTSFSLATRLLPSPMRTDIRNLYAVVRIADEIVDGACQSPALTLESYAETILDCAASRFHTDLCVHAFALTARRCSLDPDHLRAFFDSMRADLEPPNADPTSLENYVYGSAEVIGLLCLDIFLHHGSPSQPDAAHRAELEAGARALGRAFQHINFLRDIGEDTDMRGRRYFHQATQGRLTEESKQQTLKAINEDLEAATRACTLLPRSARAAVLAATAIFQELASDIARVPAPELYERRLSISPQRKARAIARALRKAELWHA